MIINPFIEIPLRAIFSYILLLVFARINGREQISQLTYYEYVVGITIGSIAATLTTVNGHLKIPIFGHEKPAHLAT